MKKILLTLVLVLLPLPTWAALSIHECVSEKNVEYITAGYLLWAHGGNNDYSAIIVKFKDRDEISMSGSVNSNDPGGKTSISFLTTAMVANLKITTWGDTGCTYIHTVRLHSAE